MHIAADGDAWLVFSANAVCLAADYRQAMAAARERHVAVLLQLRPSSHRSASARVRRVRRVREPKGPKGPKGPEGGGVMWAIETS